MAFAQDPETVNKLWSAVSKDLYDLDNRRKQLGLEGQVKKIKFDAVL